MRHLKSTFLVEIAGGRRRQPAPRVSWALAQIIVLADTWIELRVDGDEVTRQDWDVEQGRTECDIALPAVSS